MRARIVSGMSRELHGAKREGGAFGRALPFVLAVAASLLLVAGVCVVDARAGALLGVLLALSAFVRAFYGSLK